MKRLLIALSISALIFFAVAALQSGSNQSGLASIIYPEIQLSPVFEDFYDIMGGEEVLGQPISQQYDHGGVIFQYCENVLLIYDPNEGVNHGFHFAPLGWELNADRLVSSTTAIGGDHVIDGIYNQFLPLLSQIGLERAGEMLTAPFINLEKNRIEQHWGNIAIYIELDNDNATPQLMAYGRAHCASRCGVEASVPDSALFDPHQLSAPFDSFETRHDFALIGSYIAGPYPSSDELQEVIFTNVVVFENENGNVVLRPITRLVGEFFPIYEEMIASEHFFFWPLAGDLGYNVPMFLVDFIQAIGGWDYSGMPVSEFRALYPDEGIFQQCFENYCLNYYHNQPEGLRIQLAPLGQEYANRYYQNGPDGETSTAIFNLPEINNTALDSEILIVASEVFSLLPMGESQIIYVYLRDGQIPISGQQMVLNVALPDGNWVSVLLPITDENGFTSIALDAIYGQVGTNISYEVCYQAAQTCIQESFLLWEALP